MKPVFRSRMVFVDVGSIAQVLSDRLWFPDAETLAGVGPGSTVAVRALGMRGRGGDFWDSVVVWLSVTRRDGDEIRGRVLEGAGDGVRAGLRAGAEVTVPVGRIFDALPVGPDGQPGVNEERIRFAFGRLALIGVTEIGRDGEEDVRQLVGRVSSVDRVRGIGFELDGGGTFHLPPDGRALEDARPGIYRLRSSGRAVENPHFVCSWTVTQNADGSGVPSTGYEVE